MFIVKRGFVRLCDYFLRGNSDQYPVPYRKRHKRKYLELIYAFIANIVPHARLYPEMPVLPSASMKLDSAYWYFLLPFYDPPFLTIRRPRKSGNLETFIGCQVSRVFRNDRERFVAYLLFHTCPLLRSKVKKKKKKTKWSRPFSLSLTSNFIQPGTISFANETIWKLSWIEQLEMEEKREKIFSSRYNLFYNLFIPFIINVLLQIHLVIAITLIVIRENIFLRMISDDIKKTRYQRTTSL